MQKINELFKNEWRPSEQGWSPLSWRGPSGETPPVDETLFQKPSFSVSTESVPLPLDYRVNLKGLSGLKDAQFGFYSRMGHFAIDISRMVGRRTKSISKIGKEQELTQYKMNVVPVQLKPHQQAPKVSQFDQKVKLREEMNFRARLCLKNGWLIFSIWEEEFHPGNNHTRLRHGPYHATFPAHAEGDQGWDFRISGNQAQSEGEFFRASIASRPPSPPRQPPRPIGPAGDGPPSSDPNPEAQAAPEAPPIGELEATSGSPSGSGVPPLMPRSPREGEGDDDTPVGPSRSTATPASGSGSGSGETPLLADAPVSPQDTDNSLLESPPPEPPVAPEGAGASNDTPTTEEEAGFDNMRPTGEGSSSF